MFRHTTFCITKALLNETTGELRCINVSCGDSFGKRATLRATKITTKRVQWLETNNKCYNDVVFVKNSYTQCFRCFEDNELLYSKHGRINYVQKKVKLPKPPVAKKISQASTDDAEANICTWERVILYVNAVEIYVGTIFQHWQNNTFRWSSNYALNH